MSEKKPSPVSATDDRPDVGPGPSVCEIAAGGCVGTAGERGVVVLGAGGSTTGVPTEAGDLYDSGIHRIDIESALAAAAEPSDLVGKHCEAEEG